MEGKVIALILVICNLCMQCCTGDMARNETIEENWLAQFPCNVEQISSTIWLFTRRNEGSNSESISQGPLVYPRFKDKFKMEISSYNSTSHELILMFNVTEEDEGLYLCQEEGTNKAQFNLIVEIPPVLQLKRNNSVISTNIDVIFNEEVAITCIAEGGKPAVGLSWKVNGQEKTGPFIDYSPPSSERRVTSVIHYLPTVEDNKLTCVSSGQQVIPQQEISVGINVQYLLNCLIVTTNDTNAFIITCSCEANPDVETYMIYVNNTLFSKNKETTLPSEEGATVFCIATNRVDSYTTEEVVLKPFHEEVPPQVPRIALIICLSVAGVIVIVAVVLVYRKKKEADEAMAHADTAKEDAENRIDIRNKTAADMALKPIPDYDLEQDDNTPSNNPDKEGKPEKEEGSTEPHEQIDGDDPFCPSPEEEPIQEEKTPIDDPDKGTEETPNKEEENKKPLEQNDGDIPNSTSQEEDPNQEKMTLLDNASKEKEEKPNKEEIKKLLEQNDGEVPISTSQEEDLNQEKENLI